MILAFANGAVVPNPSRAGVDSGVCVDAAGREVMCCSWQVDGWVPGFMAYAGERRVPWGGDWGLSGLAVAHSPLGAHERVYAGARHAAAAALHGGPTPPPGRRPAAPSPARAQAWWQRGPPSWCLQQRCTSSPAPPRSGGCRAPGAAAARRSGCRRRCAVLLLVIGRCSVPRADLAHQLKLAPAPCRKWAVPLRGNPPSHRPHRPPPKHLHPTLPSNHKGTSPPRATAPPRAPSSAAPRTRWGRPLAPSASRRGC